MVQIIIKATLHHSQSQGRYEEWKDRRWRDKARTPSHQNCAWHVFRHIRMLHELTETKHNGRGDCGASNGGPPKCFADVSLREIDNRPLHLSAPCLKGGGGEGCCMDCRRQPSRERVVQAASARGGMAKSGRGAVPK